MKIGQHIKVSGVKLKITSIEVSQNKVVITAENKEDEQQVGFGDKR